MNVLMINNICTHFHVRTFERLAELLPIRFLFYSEGKDHYWEQSNGVQRGSFDHRYLPGFRLSRRIRVTPGLVTELLRPWSDVIVISLGGRFALPVAYLLARLRRKPFVLWTGLWAHPETFFHRLTWPLTYRIYRKADAIITYGDHVRRYLVDLGCDPEKIFCFWHAVDVEKMGRAVDEAAVREIRSRWSPDGAPVILSVGRLETVKSLDTLIEAYELASAKRPCHLVIVGHGPQRESLERLARGRGVTVRFEDFIPNDRLPEHYAVADIFCLPSRTTVDFKEPWGIVLNEAMLQRCVPVASDAVGAAMGGLFTEEMEPLRFRERDSKDLARALKVALDKAESAEVRDSMRRRSQEFNPVRQAQGLVNALQYLKARGRLPS